MIPIGGITYRKLIESGELERLITDVYYIYVSGVLLQVSLHTNNYRNLITRRKIHQPRP